MAYVLGKLDANDVDLLSLRSEIRLNGQGVSQESDVDRAIYFSHGMPWMEVDPFGSRERCCRSWMARRVQEVRGCLF